MRNAGIDAARFYMVNFYRVPRAEPAGSFVTARRNARVIKLRPDDN